jgi:glycosyltransferase involved in cell wall biosynthesis
MDPEATDQRPDPSVSVVTVCFNAAPTLEQTILSVLAQEGVNLEYVVIDGGSSDGSVAIIQRYAARLAYWCSERDRGIYHAMNKGLAQARGQWVAFLNADDYFHDPMAVRDLLQAAGNGVDVVAGGTLMRRNHVDSPFVPSRRFGLCLQIPFMHTAALVRRDAMLRYGGFDERYKIAADCDLLLRVMRGRGSPWRRVERLVSVMRDGGASDRNFLRGRFEYMQLYWRHTRNAPAALLGYVVSVLAYLKARVA